MAANTHGGKRLGAGRKPQPGPHKILRAFRLSPETDQRLQRVSALWGCTVTEALERIVLEWRQRE